MSVNFKMFSLWNTFSRDSLRCILNMILNDFFCKINNLFRVELYVHPQTWLQYVIYGYIKELYKVNKASLLRQCFALTIIPILLETFLEIRDTCSFQFKFWSITTPKNFVLSTWSISLPSIWIFRSHFFISLLPEKHEVCLFYIQRQPIYLEPCRDILEFHVDIRYQCIDIFSLVEQVCIIGI